MSLPKPIGRQKEVLYLPAQGHIAVLGTAGSGKTILAILRAAYLANRKIDHHGKTLLITFNSVLVSYLKHLQEDSIADVVVENYHKFARGYLGCRYRHVVVIDEGQDFSPEMIRSLAKAIPADGSLTFFGDVAQQIYGHRISWREAGLDIKVWEFKENYRNTQQIAKLGPEIANMPYFRGLPDIV